MTFRERAVEALSQAQGEEPSMIEARYGEELDIICPLALDFTPVEIVRAVQAIKGMDTQAMIMNEQDQMTFWGDDEATVSMYGKLQEEGNREDVKKYMDENYG